MVGPRTARYWAVRPRGRAALDTIENPAIFAQSYSPTSGNVSERATGMADANGKVMEMVREEIHRNPGVRTEELFEKAKKLDKSVAGLSVRQFHARYPLQVKRQLAAQRPRRSRPRKKPVADRAAIKAIMLQFAKDVMAAEGKAQVVDVIGGVEKYVDRVVKAAGLD
jgi:hypothetical protein